jgi:iron complex outermembrane receptor protein
LTIGASLNAASDCPYFGDSANRIATIPGYWVASLHSSYRPSSRLEVFASANNLFNRKYATRGVLADPTGIGAPGIAPDGVTNGMGVDNRFQSPAAPLELFAGLRIGF